MRIWTQAEHWKHLIMNFYGWRWMHRVALARDPAYQQSSDQRDFRRAQQMRADRPL